MVNIIGTLCVYAAICKHENKSLKFPRTKAAQISYQIGSDANLIAEQEIWAVVDPNAKNVAFNCSNEDLFKWMHLWTALAKQFDVEFVDFDDESEVEGMSLVEMMKDKGPVWEQIVREHGLEPTK
ncbi:Iridoid synthase CYC2 [Camellia lanceoleosa]|uniref:Iridoid synthase CYC2 n=1 Tax=Camellia lanceoleosa TaxID=1840588 RepID=A0ACC0HTK2_9ERIC|nr:Iridoid synthase CYC2 [Camellia lanceoleosa]